VAIGLLVVAVAGCASYATGHYHTVSRGENLYRIGLRYGVDSHTLADVNGIDDVTTLRVGQRIWIPKQTTRQAAHSSSAPVRPRDPAAARDARAAARREAEREASLAFAWPVEAVSVSSRYGRRRGRNHDGIDLRAPRGARILAAEAGKVIHSGWLGDYGKVVIIKHAGSYRTVYAHARKLHVKKGEFVDRGQRIGEVGATGNATGPHLHFEIRKGERPRDPMLYLP
jgi:murein DD-endopeptidase MepM/ murein hydrolase activator NlpD